MVSPVFRRRFQAWVMGVGVLAGASAAPAQTVTLKPKLEPGDPSFIELREECTREVAESGSTRRPTETRISQIIVVSRTIEALPEDRRRIHLIFDRLALHIQGKGEELAFDTDVDTPETGTPMLAAVLRPMIAMPMTMDVDADGRALSFGGMDELFDAVQRTAGDNPFLLHLRGALTNEASKAMWGDARRVLFPDQPVRVGDTWTGSFIQPYASLGSARYDFHCTYARIGPQAPGGAFPGQRAAVVSYTADITQVTPAAPKPAPPAGEAPRRAITNLKGHLMGEATYLFDVGDFVHDGGTMKLTMTIVLPPADGGEPQTFDVEQACGVSMSILTPPQREAQRIENRARAPRDGAPPHRGVLANDK